MPHPPNIPAPSTSHRSCLFCHNHPQSHTQSAAYRRRRPRLIHTSLPTTHPCLRSDHPCHGAPLPRGCRSTLQTAPKRGKDRRPCAGPPRPWGYRGCTRTRQQWGREAVEGAIRTGTGGGLLHERIENLPRVDALDRGRGRCALRGAPRASVEANSAVAKHSRKHRRNVAALIPVRARRCGVSAYILSAACCRPCAHSLLVAADSAPFCGSGTPTRVGPQAPPRGMCKEWHIQLQTQLQGIETRARCDGESVLHPHDLLPCSCNLIHACVD